jgi:hypothetical protein
VQGYQLLSTSYIYSHILFCFSSKAEAQWPMDGQVVLARAEALPLISAPPAKKEKRGAETPKKDWRGTGCIFY